MRQDALRSLRRNRSIQAAIWHPWVFIFSNWPALKEALIALKDQNSCDFGKHILPYCKEKGDSDFLPMNTMVTGKM